MCYLNDFYDISLIVAEFKKLDGARYSKEIHPMTQVKKLTKIISEKVRFASIRGLIEMILTFWGKRVLV